MDEATQEAGTADDSAAPGRTIPVSAPRAEVALGLLVAAMARLPRYRALPIGDLVALAIEPVARGRVTVVPPPQGAPAHLPAFAIWATVSDDVDTRLREEAAGGAFPLRLAPEEWESGERLWLLDLIAPTRAHATIALIDFGRRAGERPVRTHPLIRELVDPAVYERLRGAGPAAPAASDTVAADG